MVRLAFVLVDTQEEAEEAVQDAFAAVLPRFGRLDNPEAYLRLCVLNRCRQVLRRRRVVRRQPAPRIDDSALGFNHLLDAVRRLPHRQRSAVVLRFEMQLTDAEIAESLRMPIGTVNANVRGSQLNLAASSPAWSSRNWSRTRRRQSVEFASSAHVVPMLDILSR
jgi:RNA polymerase sigma factor (sigma-70 family)